jgi:hypothetical protein
MRVVIEGKVFMANMRAVASVHQVVSDLSFENAYIISINDRLPGRQHHSYIIGLAEFEKRNGVEAG